jgi:flagellar biosynthesis component FlhA
MLEMWNTTGQLKLTWQYRRQPTGAKMFDRLKPMTRYAAVPVLLSWTIAMLLPVATAYALDQWQIQQLQAQRQQQLGWQQQQKTLAQQQKERNAQANWYYYQRLYERQQQEHARLQAQQLQAQQQQQFQFQLQQQQANLRQQCRSQCGMSFSTCQVSTLGLRDDAGAINCLTNRNMCEARC